MDDDPSIRTAFQAVLQSARLLNRRPPQAVEAWIAIEPFVACTHFAGVSERRSNAAVGMILSTAADCRRELGDARHAADLYRLALESREFLGFADYYATLVLEHGLRDHWPDAVRAVQMQRDRWARRSTTHKALAYAIWWLRYGLWRPDMRLELRRIKAGAERLLQAAGLSR